MPFRTPTDIANRACQHMGVRTLDRTLGFNEDSVQALEISTCYDNLRVAELERNLWVFSTRRAVLRPIGMNTMILDPPLWSSSTTYFPGAIVKTVEGDIWFSTDANNFNNQPGASPSWDGYFGAMSCDPIVSGISYSAGDITFVVGTNGIPSVYLSLVNSNSDVPSVAQSWVSLDSNGDPFFYFKDQVVSYSGTLYQSLIDLNGGNHPGLAPAIWAVGTTYAAGTQVTGSNAVVYTSVSSGNVGHSPTSNPTYWTPSGLSNPAAWAVGTTYAAGAQVVGSDGVIYSSIAGGNVGNNPPASPATWTNTGAYAPWTTTVTNTNFGSLNWSKLGVALKKLTLAYPIGCGPVEDRSSRNVYHLPAGHLRVAPQNPKSAVNTIFGGPSFYPYDDWEFESRFITTSNFNPINYRFVANIHGVEKMDTMFCEGLGARIGLECCQRVTQSDTKVKEIGQAYDRFMGEARTVNSIEIGAIDPPEDDYITIRR